ncbi:Diacylglycerol kinase family enzyme [Raineyella antarctica]|uniref:Diacylglycerol kinase family enzyme n=1 Tax=Raineyella antarctica TaxID=1577474 RepID=A0A1G6GDE6_9ACTN|nr:diacylglycerol kinase family protein [Raineyella antarctica]SDB80017.1 Diacylglycerol kinase family enzyme [Raineyella antarctica]
MSAGGIDLTTVRETRVGLVLNPRGRLAERARRELDRVLASAAAPPALVLRTTVARPGADQARELLRAGVDLVVVAGGDGTVREVVSVLAGSGIPLGILPTGTANLFARNLGLGRGPARAARTALAGRELVLDVGRARVRTTKDPTRWQGPLTFLVMAGIGRDARAVEATGLRLKRALGWVAYLAAGIGEALRRPLPMLVDLDGRPRRTRTWTVLFGNCPRIPGGIAVFPRARPDDGQLDTLEVALRSPFDWLAVAAFGVFGRPRRVRALSYGRTSHARVTPEQPVAVQLDGDVVAGVLELEVGVDAHALLVRTPLPRHRSQRRRAVGRRWPLPGSVPRRSRG